MTTDETTAAREPKPLSAERIAEVLTDLSPDTLRMIISDLRAVAAERDAEIARQLGWLVHLSVSEQPQLNWESRRVRDWYRMHLDMAINGDEVPE